MYFYLYLALVIPYNRNFTVYDFDLFPLSSSSFMGLIANPLSDGHAQLANLAQLVKKPAPVLQRAWVRIPVYNLEFFSKLFATA